MTLGAHDHLFQYIGHVGKTIKKKSGPCRTWYREKRQQTKGLEVCPQISETAVAIIALGATNSLHEKSEFNAHVIVRLLW